jgi:serine/threonine protein kinase
MGSVGGSSAPRFDARASLVRECLALARLDHPNIVHLWDAGTDESGEPFAVLELLERPRTIADWAHAAPPPLRLVALVQMFEALAHVHSAKLVHGDVKPSNVLLGERSTGRGPADTSRPRVCLVDFGLSAGPYEAGTETERGANGRPSLAGSALYLAPERIEGAPPSSTSDIYAAGMIAVEVLTGADPTRRASPRTTLTALRDFGTEWLKHTAGPLGLDRSAVTLLQRLLARDSARRLGAAEAALALRWIFNGTKKKV